MRMKLTILGSGTYKPLPDRGPAGYWLEAGGLNILLDAGSGTLGRLTKAGKDYQDIDVIVVSHIHPDHVSDLAALFHVMYGNAKRPRTKPLRVFGGIGYKKWHSGLISYFSQWPSSGKKNKLTIFESVKRKELKGVTFTFAKGNHDESSILTKITHKRKTLVYTSDTGYDHGLVEFCDGADAVIVECNDPAGHESTRHMNPSLCGTLAQEAGTKHLIVSHLSPEILKTLYKQEIRKHYKGKLIAAKDLLEVPL